MLDANELERIARERPDKYFLKGSGVLKLTGAIRQLEAEVARLSGQQVNPPIPTNPTPIDQVPAGPRDDDGQALRLVVQHRLGLVPLEGGGWDVEGYAADGRARVLASCANGGAWALREAIADAAAASGVAIPRLPGCKWPDCRCVGPYCETPADGVTPSDGSQPE